MSGPWPRPGRCTACLEPAEQYPSGRWRHLSRPCPSRSQWLWRPGGLPMPPVGFVGDDEPDPVPERWHSTVEYENGIPARMRLHPPEAVVAYWGNLRVAAKEAIR